MNTHVDKNGRVFVVEGKKRTEVAPGYEKCWIYENVYGWYWVGSITAIAHPFYMQIHLVVLGFEPNLAQRREIEARFADAQPPGPVFRPDVPITMQ